MPFDPAYIPERPYLACMHLWDSLQDKSRKEKGLFIAERYRDAACEIRNSIGGPREAYIESRAFEEQAIAWDQWAEGEAVWAAFCQKNRNFVNRTRKQLGLQPIPTRKRSSSNTAGKSKKNNKDKR